MRIFSIIARLIFRLSCSSWEKLMIINIYWYELIRWIPKPCRCPSPERLENHCRAFVRPPVVVTLSRVRGPLEAPLNDGMVHVELRVLSYSIEEVICLPSEVWQESWPNFRWLPKVSEVATNHWVFLRCDWSPISSWFYYQS